MTLTDISADNLRVDYDLCFLKPCEGTSKCSFALVKAEEDDEKTTITWIMEGTLPIFLFFKRRMMSAMIGGDYERGLVMLKEFLENGNVASKVEVQPVSHRGGFRFIGVRKDCSIDNIGPSMEKDFKRLNETMKGGDFPQPDFCFSFYHSWDLVNGRCDYTSGFAYSNGDEHILSGIHCEFETGKVGVFSILDRIGTWEMVGGLCSIALLTTIFASQANSRRTRYIKTHLVKLMKKTSAL